jgi:hypothetical protein
MADQPRGGPVEPPTKWIMTACEVVTWIAFRRAIPQERLGVLFKVTLDRWLAVPADTVLDALETRAGISGNGPFYAIRIGPGPRFDFDSHPSRYMVLSEKGPAILRLISRVHRREAGRLLSYADLARKLREEIAADERVSEQIEEAKAQIRDRAAGGLLVAFGIRVEPDGKRRGGAVHEALRASLFMHPAITLTEWDTVHTDTTRPLKEWWDEHLPRFEDMRFRTAEVLALWPHPLSLDYDSAMASSPSSQCDSEAPHTDSCTLTDAIARIAYGNEYDGRYYAAPGDTWAEGETRQRRKVNRRYPTNSGLPGISNLAGMKNPEYDMALAAWKQADSKRWRDAEHFLLAKLLAGTVKAFDEIGHAVPAEFWLSNNLHSPRARAFRLKGADLHATLPVPAGTAAPSDQPETAASLSAGLPPDLANDPSASAAFDEMCRYARQQIASQGKPPKRDEAAQAANRIVTTYPVRKARGLYRYLPPDLRNPSRTLRS